MFNLYYAGVMAHIYDQDSGWVGDITDISNREYKEIETTRMYNHGYDNRNSTYICVEGSINHRIDVVKRQMVEFGLTAQGTAVDNNVKSVQQEDNITKIKTPKKGHIKEFIKTLKCIIQGNFGDE